MSDTPGIIHQLDEILRLQPDLSEQAHAIAEINKQLQSLEPIDTVPQHNLRAESLAAA
jgi:hypothetical protein